MKKNLRNTLNEIVTKAVQTAVNEAVDRIGKLTLADVQDKQTVVVNAARRVVKTPKAKVTVKAKNLTARAKALKLNGQYMGMLRAFSATDTKRIKKIRIEKGVAAAIAAMKNGLPKVAKKAVVKAAPKTIKKPTKTAKPKKIEEETPVETKDAPVAEQQATVVEQPTEVSAPAADATPVDVT